MYYKIAVVIVALLGIACGDGNPGVGSWQQPTLAQGGGPVGTIPARIAEPTVAAAQAGEAHPSETERSALPEAPPAPAVLPEPAPSVVQEAAPSAAAATEEPFSLTPAAWASAPVASASAAATLPPVDAVAAVVLDEASGAILWERNAYQALPPASLTKIVTALVALEHGDLERWVQSDIDWREMPGSSVMGLERGEWFRMQDLLYGLMLPSGNDAALVIGRDIAGSDAAFVAEMNALVQRLGLKSAQFANAHGLGSRNQISALDLAYLGRYAMSIDEFRPLSWTRYHVAQGHSRKLAMGNLNGILSDIPGADGIKVGFTYRAGKTLVASATRDGHRVYAVLLNAPSSRADGAKLLEWAFANHTWQ